MENKLKELKAYMAQEKQQTQGMIDALVADERADEARPYRAALNIYDVFASFLDVSWKQSKGEAAAFKDGFHKLAENVPSQWRASLVKAKEHNDAEKVLIEEAKLQVADCIIEKFDTLF